MNESLDRKSSHIVKTRRMTAMSWYLLSKSVQESLVFSPPELVFEYTLKGLLSESDFGLTFYNMFLIFEQNVPKYINWPKLISSPYDTTSVPKIELSVKFCFTAHSLETTSC